MLSYIVGFIAFLIFVVNPLTQIIWPSRTVHRASRPQLNESLIALDGPNQSAIDCPADAYSVHIFSRSPLVLYIEGFLSLADQEHLLSIRYPAPALLASQSYFSTISSNPIFEPSTITNDGEYTYRDSAVRESEVALIPRTDSVRCIEGRARALQGWKDELWIERLRTQRYTPGGHYNHHFDWSSNMGGWGRVSSFMVWVAADDVEGGGTEFPYLSLRSEDPRWCRFIECKSEGNATEEAPSGVIFKPIPGNAVLWENFRPDGSGSGYQETWHAGLPVAKGVKVGLNIWSWGRID